MPLGPKDAYDRITRTSTTWGNLRAKKSFAGLSLEKFNALVAPSVSVRTTIARLDNELIAAQNQRDEADRVSLDAVQLVVNGIKGDPEEGEDGELYEALGYVRKSERKSGLHRAGKTTAPSA
jgi:hypothetical protein